MAAAVSPDPGSCSACVRSGKRLLAAAEWDWSNVAHLKPGQTCARCRVTTAPRRAGVRTHPAQAGLIQSHRAQPRANRISRSSCSPARRTATALANPAARLARPVRRPGAARGDPGLPAAGGRRPSPRPERAGNPGVPARRPHPRSARPAGGQAGPAVRPLPLSLLLPLIPGLSVAPRLWSRLGRPAGILETVLGLSPFIKRPWAALKPRSQ